jgi:Fic family protein
LTESIQKNLHEFDLLLSSGLYKSPITNFDKIEYLQNSLLEEAIASSQIEGAATTTQVAYEMLKTGRKPRNESEQMIFNNLKAIKFIEEEIESPLNYYLIIEIHSIMTANTKAEYCAGSFRDSEVFIQDFSDGEVAHIPPAHNLVNSLMQSLSDFANDDKVFVHPIIKASILHFMIGFIHPFKDGNGRTARALFYWYLFKKGYGWVKNVSISRAILESRIQYDKAFLKTEYDGNDLTYFILYSLKTLRIAFDKLLNYRDKKKEEREKSNLVSYKLIERGFLKRQADLIGMLYTNPNEEVNTEDYNSANNIVRQTARKDLNQLVKMGLIQSKKNGKVIIYKLSSVKKVDEFLES